MTPKQALNLLSQVAAIYKGTLEEHQSLQEAVKVLTDYIGPDTLKDKKDK